MVTEKLAVTMLAFLLVPLSFSDAVAQGLHVNPNVKDCSIELDPLLTQRDFRKFVGEGGELLTFRVFSAAEPLGRGRFNAGITYSQTYLDDLHPSWNNTFTHPDETHYLGDLAVPVLYGAVGLTDAIDIGASFTTNPAANYAFLGGALRYTFLRESVHALSASLTASYVRLLRVDDLRFDLYAIDLTASKRVWVFVPYVGVRESFGRAIETSPNVDLDSENVWGTQGMAGVRYRLSFLDLGLEATLARQFTWAVKTGFSF